MESYPANGIEVIGIQNKELPLVSMNMVIAGGVLLDKVELPELLPWLPVYCHRNKEQDARGT
jgi:hypothetical protein